MKNIDKVAAECISNIIGNKGLGKSTFRDNFPEAYKYLKKHYIPDMTQTIIEILKKRQEGTL